MPCSCSEPSSPATAASTRYRRAVCLVLLALVAGACLNEPIDSNEVRQHVGWLEQSLERVHTAKWQARWQQQTTGHKVAPVQVPGQALPFFEIGNFWRWHGRVNEPELARSVELLYRHTLKAQLDFNGGIAQQTGELVQLGIAPRSLDGRPCSADELRRIIRHDPDRSRREAAWKALFADADGAQAAGLSRLIQRRNAVAASLGFASFYQLTLALEGLQAREVDELLRALDRATREPAWQLARQLTRRLGPTVQALRPWDTEQQMAEIDAALAPSLGRNELVPRLHQTLAGIGLDDGRVAITQVNGAAGRGHRVLSFPLAIPDDIRMLIFPGDGPAAYQGCLRELGHATYLGHVAQQAFAERLPPNSAFADGFAGLFEQLACEPAWLEGIAGVPPDLAAAVASETAAADLLRVRFLLARHHFERAAYEHPEQDLGLLYVSIMSQLSPVSWHGLGQTWAAELDLSLRPFSSLGHLLARLLRAQVEQAVEQRFGGLCGHPDAGRFLIEKLAAPGSSRPWQETLQQATGRRLSVDAYAAELQQWAAQEQEQKGSRP